jgi:acyl-CoA thioesterase-1
MHKAIILAKFYFLPLLGNFRAVGRELDKGVSLSPGVPRHLPNQKALKSVILEMAGRMNLSWRNIVLFLIAVCISSSCSNVKRKNEAVLKPVFKPEPKLGVDEQDKRPIIVAFGNSLTAGSGVDPIENYPSKLQARIDAAGYRYRVVNAGVSGDTSSQGLNRIQNVIALRPAIAIVELGANDGLRGLPVEVTHRNLVAIVSRLQSAGAKVLLAGMRMPPNYGPEYTASFRKIFADVAEQCKASLIPFFLEGVGGHPELNQADGIHPTAEGYDVVVENVWKVLEPLL